MGRERLHGALPLPIISSLPPTRALNVSGSTRRLAESCRLVWPALARTCILYVSLLPSHTISWVTLIHPFPGDRIVWAFSSNRDSGLLGGYRGQKRKEPTQEREIHNNAKFVYILPLGSSFIQIFSRVGFTLKSDNFLSKIHIYVITRERIISAGLIETLEHYHHSTLASIGGVLMLGSPPLFVIKGLKWTIVTVTTF